MRPAAPTGEAKIKSRMPSRRSGSPSGLPVRVPAGKGCSGYAAKIKRIAIEKWRGNIWSQAIELPGNLRGVGNVAFRSRQPDGEHGLPIIAVAGKHHALSGHRRRNDISREPCAFPKQSARCQVIASHPFGRADDNLRFTFMLDHQRRGPGSFFVTSNFPTLLSGALVEASKEKSRPRGPNRGSARRRRARANSLRHGRGASAFVRGPSAISTRR